MRPWVKLYREGTSISSQLPLYTRALHAQLVRLADDDGRIALGGRDPASAIAWLAGATRGDRRMLRRDLQRLIASRLVTVDDTFITVTGNDRVTTVSRPGHDGATTGSRPCHDGATKMALSTRNHTPQKTQRREEKRSDQIRKEGVSSSPPETSPPPQSDRSGAIERAPSTDLVLEPTSPTLSEPDAPDPLDAPAPKRPPTLVEIRAEVAQLEERYSSNGELLEQAKVAGGLARNRRGELTDRQWLTFLRRLATHDLADAVEALSRYVERHPDGEKPIEYALGIARGIALERKAGGRVPMPGLSRTGERVHRPPRRWHGVLDNPTVDDEPDDGSADRIAAEWNLDFSKCIDVKR